MKQLFLIILLFSAGLLHAQEREWSVDECMSYAVENSPQAKKQHYTNENYRQNKLESMASMMPSVSASGNANWGFGRGIDPSTNTYGNMANFNNEYVLSGSMPLFNGLSRVNTLRAANIARLRGTQEAQKIADDVAMATMQAYFDVLYYTGMVELANQQLEESKANLSKTAKMVELGLKTHSDVAQNEAQVASDDYNLTRQNNLLESAMLHLKKSMSYPFDKSLTVKSKVDERLYAPTTDGVAVYGYAKENLPQALISSYRVREAELSYSATKGRQYPEISASGGYSTNYYRNLTLGEASGSFNSQLSDNGGEWVGVTIRIPIFNGLARRTAINRSRNNMNIAEQEKTEAERQLQSEIAQAILDVEGLSKEHVQTIKRSAAYDEAHKGNKRKFEQGTISAIELQTSANQLLLARTEELRTQLMYQLRGRLLEFYKGKPLIEK